MQQLTITEVMSDSEWLPTWVVGQFQFANDPGVTRQEARFQGTDPLTRNLRATQKFSTIQALLSPGVGISKIPCRPSGD